MRVPTVTPALSAAAGPTLAAALACLALAAPAGAAAPKQVVDKGIVTRVTPTVLVLRALDGARLRLHLNGATRVVLNGHAAHVADLAPGLAASARHTAGGRVTVVQAVGTPRPPITQERGTIEAVQPEGLVLRRPDGTALAVAVGPATRVLLRGVPAAAADLVPGLTAVVRHRGTQPALSVRAFGKAPG